MASLPSMVALMSKSIESAEGGVEGSVVGTMEEVEVRAADFGEKPILIAYGPAPGRGSEK